MIIGICGLIGSGKGTVSDILVNNYGFTKISFAERLKDTLALLFSWDRQLLEGDSVESRIWRETVDEYWSKELNQVVTPRKMMQLIGTDCLRKYVNPDIWISITKQKIMSDMSTNWVISDARFINELDMIKSINGKIWEISRGTDPTWKVLYEKNGIIPDIHRSEWEWINYPKDKKILNNSTIEELTNKIITEFS